MSALLPLVAPGVPLDRDDVARYSRHLILPDVRVDGQRRLRSARVLVIGAGGLGSPVLLYLAAAGVGTIGIVEFDTVELSNLQRQVIHGESDVGRPKAHSARDAIREVNSTVEVRLHELRLDPDNAVELFSQYDLIIDGTDNFATRYLVNDAAALAGKPYVYGSVYRFEGQVSVFWENAPDGRGIDYRDVYPEAPPPELAPNCAEGGVLGVLCATVGSIMATEAVKLITGAGEPLLGRLLIYDALRMEYQTLKLRRSPKRVPVTELIDYEAFCGVVSEEARLAAADAAITAPQLRELLDRGTDVVLVDVREPAEWDIVHIDGATLVPKDQILSGEALGRLPRDRPLVLHCRSGVRSAEVLIALRAAGFDNVRHLHGGILAWAKQVDTTLPVY
ncbi:MAG TPA: adenylyltransferase/sulfurtransferase MoeZ [Actinocrinis sp.]|uniref:adenylyltransferase/sulfurtransferase MoeZ n=1 Tax=Actinocrinis sp. TaxID=1920516 RepID=UPI002DDCDB1D|nr:adenylyltransferase/sulfurtransferase MoeZ [Actinocrinis sp.]HEV2345914.1 adenylyltransferase/sulfurtransferase MoeZ [Actinocrinis sp.]